MATIYEVSKLAGVSLATVSRVMNGTAKVSEKTQKKVKAAMQDLGYVPNSVAISLASKRSNCVGILVADLDGLFFGNMMQGIEGALRKKRKHVVITAGHGDIEQEKQGIEFLKSRNCDALIIHAERLTDDYLIELSRGKTPIYVLNRFIPELTENCITLDNYYGGKLATDFVLEQGHTQLVNIAGPTYKIDALQRVEGFKTALSVKGIKFDKKRVFQGNFLQDSGEAAIDYFIKESIDFTAIVCGNDQIAIGAMARLREQGLVPGKDVAVMGFDDMAFAYCTHPRLSTIKYPIKEMGKVAADMVLKHVYRVDMNDIPRVFEPTLIKRDSVQAV